MTERSDGQQQVLHGCGTLEMMRRMEQPILSSRMAYEIQRNRREQNEKHFSTAKQYQDSSPITGMGEIQARGGKLKAIARDAPQQKRLIGGRLQRTIIEEEDDDHSCRGSEQLSSRDDDGDDGTTTTSSIRSAGRQSLKSKKSSSSSRYSVDSRLEELKDLRREQLDLEEQLLKVTRKMNHKFSKAKKDNKFASKKGDKMKEIARMWRASDESPSEVPQQQYQAYMKSRYTTQAQLDFYRKKPDKYNIAKHHRQKNIHGKYGNELVKCKISLRGQF